LNLINQNLVKVVLESEDRLRIGEDVISAYFKHPRTHNLTRQAHKHVMSMSG